MCGYDPFEQYEQQLDREYLAFEHGFESYEDYQNYLDDNKANDDYDSISDERIIKWLKKNCNKQG